MVQGCGRLKVVVLVKVVPPLKLNFSSGRGRLIFHDILQKPDEVGFGELTSGCGASQLARSSAGNNGHLQGTSSLRFDHGNAQHCHKLSSTRSRASTSLSSLTGEYSGKDGMTHFLFLSRSALIILATALGLQQKRMLHIQVAPGPASQQVVGRG